MSIQRSYPTSHPPSTLHYQSATLTAAILISENLSAQSSLSVGSRSTGSGSGTCRLKNCITFRGIVFHVFPLFRKSKDPSLFIVANDPMVISGWAFTWIIQKTVPFFGLRLPGCWCIRVSVRLRWLCWLALCTNSEAWYSWYIVKPCAESESIWMHPWATATATVAAHDHTWSTDMLQIATSTVLPQHVGLTKAKMHATQRPKSWVLASPREATSTAATWRLELNAIKRNQFCATQVLNNSLSDSCQFLSILLLDILDSTYLTFWTSVINPWSHFGFNGCRTSGATF